MNRSGQHALSHLEIKFIFLTPLQSWVIFQPLHVFLWTSMCLSTPFAIQTKSVLIRGASPSVAPRDCYIHPDTFCCCMWQKTLTQTGLSNKREFLISENVQNRSGVKIGWIIYDFHMKKIYDLSVSALSFISINSPADIPHSGTNDCGTSILRYPLWLVQPISLMPQAQPSRINNVRREWNIQIVKPIKSWSWWGLGKKVSF